MMVRTLKRKTTDWKGFFLGLIIAACFLIAVPPLAAQQGQQGYGGQQQQGQQGYQQQQQPTDFDDSELKVYAKAKNDVDDIRSEYSDALRGVEEADKARELQNKYTEKMIDAIEEKDLSVKKYNQISQAMQNSPELREKIEDYQ